MPTAPVANGAVIPRGDVVIIGCGNLLRGDDGVGPLLVRRLSEIGVPAGVRLIDGGTAGLEVAWQMAGAREVAIVDACKSGAEPGAIFELPGEDVETPQPAGMNLHALRWDHALAFGRRLLKERFPPRVTVFLIEAHGTEPGYGLSPPVEDALRQVADALLRRFGADDENEERGRPRA
jgi:hydrogenase maturation protease